MPRLSLAMIVKDEEPFLAHCLESVQGLVDDLVVVDTGSRDATVAIAESHGARVFRMPWKDDFSAARNEALAHCQGDWVLVLDADEAIDALDFPRIRAAMEQDAIPAWRLILRNYTLSGNATNLDRPAQANRTPYREGAAYPHYADTDAIRLCRLLPGLAFEGRIHELLAPYFHQRNLPVERLEAVVHHYGKTAQDREIRKTAYYLALALQDVRAYPSSYQAQYNLLNTALVAADWPRVLEAGRACRRLLPGFPEPLVLLGLGMAHQSLGDPAASLAALEELLASQPEHTLGLVRSALSLARLGRLPEAKARLLKAADTAPGFALPWLNLGEIQAQTGEALEARDTFRKGLQAAPGDLSLMGALVRLDLQLQRIDLALEDARLALEAHPGGGAGLWHRILAATLLHQDQGAEAREWVNRGLAFFPDDPDLMRLLEQCRSGAPEASRRKEPPACTGQS